MYLTKNGILLPAHWKEKLHEPTEIHLYIEGNALLRLCKRSKRKGNTLRTDEKGKIILNEEAVRSLVFDFTPDIRQESKAVVEKKESTERETNDSLILSLVP